VISYGTNIAYKNITTYFRRAFVSPDPTNFATLLLRLLRDDGAVVYLNGVETWRDNMPPGTIFYSTVSSGTAWEATSRPTSTSRH